MKNMKTTLLALLMTGFTSMAHADPDAVPMVAIDPTVVIELNGGREVSRKFGYSDAIKNVFQKKCYLPFTAGGKAAAIAQHKMSSVIIYQRDSQVSYAVIIDIKFDGKRTAKQLDQTTLADAKDELVALAEAVVPSQCAR